MTSRLGKIGFLRRGSSAKSIRSKLEEELRNPKLQLFDFAKLKFATNNFRNIIRHGSFGAVYKGEFEDGKLIAVERFETKSNLSLEELKNLLVYAWRLEHTNIMKLIGYCVEDEKVVLIVHDYMPNGTLDMHLFDASKRQQLDWETRYKIIEGIANGLLYLHEGLDFRMIHRDIKPASILLDNNMNPKISDFSLAVTLPADQLEGTCERIVGTYGYMATEYAMHGQYSTKLDIFSFGVTILEIITGQKCKDFYGHETGLNFISYVLKHWKEGTLLEAMDSSFLDECLKEEVMRCIQIGLACAQENPEDRPTIASVVLMLISNAIRVPHPKQPLQRDYHNTDYYYDSEVPIDSENEEGR